MKLAMLRLMEIKLYESKPARRRNTKQEFSRVEARLYVMQLMM